MKQSVAKFSELNVLYGRCLHRGALMSDGFVDGQNLICGVHDWDYRLDTGVSEYDNDEALHKFGAGSRTTASGWTEDEIDRLGRRPPAAVRSRRLPGALPGHPPAPPTSRTGASATSRATACRRPASRPGERWASPADDLPSWDDIQLTDSAARAAPLLDDDPVGTELVIGPNATEAAAPRHPDLRFRHELRGDCRGGEGRARHRRGSRGHRHLLGRRRHAARRAGRPIRATSTNSPRRVSASRGRSWKGAGVPFQGRSGREDRNGRPPAGQQGRREDRRGARPRARRGRDLAGHLSGLDRSLGQIRTFADEVRDRTGGIPIGYKLSAQHIEKDIDAALEVGVDYIILDGRGGGTGSAPLLFRDNISVPTIPALARERGAISTVLAARRDAGDHRRPACRRTSSRRWRSAPTHRGLQFGDAGDRLPRRCGRATPTIARSGSPRRNRIWSIVSWWKNQPGNWPISSRPRSG
jgi:hypothetical protein